MASAETDGGATSPEAEQSDSQITVRVRTLAQATHELQVPDTCTVQQLKLRLVDTVSLPVDRQRLIYRGRVLQDDQQLTAAGFESEHTLHLVEMLPRPPETQTPQQQAAGQAAQGGLPPNVQHHFAIGSIDFVGNGDPAQFMEAVSQMMGMTAGGMPAEGPAYQRQDARVIDRHPMESIALYLDHLRRSSGTERPTGSAPSWPGSVAGFRDRFIAAARFILQDREIPAELQDWLEAASAQALPTALMGVSPIWHMQTPPAMGGPAPTQHSSSRPTATAASPASQQPGPSTAQSAAAGPPADTSEHAQPSGSAPSQQPQQQAGGTGQAVRQQAQQAATVLPGAGQASHAEASSAGEMQGFAPFEAILQQLQHGIDQAVASGLAAPATPQSTSGSPAAGSAQVPDSPLSFGPMHPPTTDSWPQIPPGLPHPGGPGSGPVLVGMQSMQVTIGPEGIVSASVGPPVQVTEQGPSGLPAHPEAGEGSAEPQGQPTESSNPLAALEQHMMDAFELEEQRRAAERAIWRNGPPEPDEAEQGAQEAAEQPSAQQPPQQPSQQPPQQPPQPDNAAQQWRQQRAVHLPGQQQRQQLPWPSTEEDMHNAMRVAALVTAELVSRLQHSIRHGLVADLHRASSHISTGANQAERNARIQGVQSSSSRTSRQMLRTGAAILELGRAAGSLSHAAQGHLGPLVYGYTAFLRPDGRAATLPVQGPGRAAIARPAILAPPSAAQARINQIQAAARQQASAEGNRLAAAAAAARAQQAARVRPTRQNAPSRAPPPQLRPGSQPAARDTGHPRTRSARRYLARTLDLTEQLMRRLHTLEPLHGSFGTFHAAAAEQAGRMRTVIDSIDAHDEMRRAEGAGSEPAEIQQAARASAAAGTSAPTAAASASEPSQGAAPQAPRLTFAADEGNDTATVHVGDQTIQIELLPAILTLAHCLRTNQQLSGLFTQGNMSSAQAPDDSNVPWGVIARSILGPAVASILSRAAASPGLANANGTMAASLPSNFVQDESDQLGEDDIAAAVVTGLVDAVTMVPSPQLQVPVPSTGAAGGQAADASEPVHYALQALLNGTEQAAGSPAYFSDSEPEADDDSADETPVQADGRPSNPRLPKRTRTQPPGSSQPGTSTSTSSHAAHAAQQPAQQQPAQQQNSMGLSEQSSTSRAHALSHTTLSAPMGSPNAATGRSARQEALSQQQLIQQNVAPLDSKPDNAHTAPAQTPGRHTQVSPPPAQASTSTTSEGSKPPAAPQGLGSGLRLPARKPKPSGQPAHKPATTPSSSSTGGGTSSQAPQQQVPKRPGVLPAAVNPSQASGSSQGAATRTAGAGQQVPDSGVEEIDRQPSRRGMPQGMGGLGQLLGEVTRAAGATGGQDGSQGNAGGGSGLMGMLNQMMQSPALQQMAEQLADGQMSSEGRTGQDSTPDIGSMVQQMMPMVSQMFGSSMASGPNRSASSAVARHSPASGVASPSQTSSEHGLNVLSTLPPERAEHWRRTIIADREQQAHQQRRPLSEVYRTGKPGHMPSDPLD